MKTQLFTLLLLLSNIALSQVIDSCFTSAIPDTNFESSYTLANTDLYDADLMEWTGTEWIGAHENANIDIVPPGNVIGSRAMFIGNGETWMAAGEGFALLLEPPIVSGQTYSFDLTYVSEGSGSDGNFAPDFYTHLFPYTNGGYQVGNLEPASYSWVTNTVTFTADPAQDGHDWIIIHTGFTGSSGLVFQLCDVSNIICDFSIGSDTTLCVGDSLVLDATTPNATYVWKGGSTSPTLTVTEAGTYWVQVNLANCSSIDTITIFEDECLLTIHDLANSTVNIYPNPAIDLINIDVEADFVYQARLYDLAGKLFISEKNPNKILINDLPAGTYLLEITDLDTSQKIIERILITE